MKKKKSKQVARSTSRLSSKWLFLTVSSFVILVFISSGIYQTYASLTDNDKIRNDFKVGGLQTEIEEEFREPDSLELGKEYAKKVTVKNTSEQAVFVRVLSAPMLTKKQTDGNKLVLPIQTIDEKDISLVDYNTTDWIDGKDGYFYYKKKLEKKASSTNLFTKVKVDQMLATADDYKGARLTIEIKDEAIGTTKYTYRDAWWKGAVPTTNPLAQVDKILAEQTD